MVHDTYLVYRYLSLNVGGICNSIEQADLAAIIGPQEYSPPK